MSHTSMGLYGLFQGYLYLFTLYWNTEGNNFFYQFLNAGEIQ
jgi:hypothetical protein